MTGSTDDGRICGRDIDSGRDRRLRVPIAAHAPHRVAGPPGARCPSVSARRESCASPPAAGATPAVDRRRSAPTRRARVSVGPWTVAGDRDRRDSGHAASLASAAHRPEVDVRQTLRESSWSADGDSASDGADGGRESDVGLHTNPRSAEERRASRGPFDNRPDPEGRRRAASARAADLLADILARALGRHRRSRFLHHGSVDVAWACDVLHRICHRLSVCMANC